MPPFITGVSALNFMTRFSGGLDLSKYEDIGAGIRALNTSSGGYTYGDYIRAIEYMGNGVILAGSAGANVCRIYKSTDGGATWSVAHTFNAINHVSSITRLGTSNDVVIATTGGHGHDGNVYRSGDAGDSWVLENNWGGGRASGHDNVYSSEYIHNNVFLHGGGYNEGDGSVWRSADGGLNWTDLRGSNSSGTTMTGNVGWDNNSVFDASIYGSQFYSSTDSWWVLNLKYVGNGVVLANRRPVRLGSTSGSGSNTVPELIRSTDYGINWTKVTTQTTNFLNSGQLVTENLGNGKVIGVTNAEGSTNSDNANVYISNDYGETWDETPKFTVNRNRAYAVTHLGNGHVVFLAYHWTGSAYLANGGEVYESLNYGETWNSTPVFDPGVLFLLSAKFNPDDNVLYVGGSLDDVAPVLYKLG
mgnify:CR=1 FL=1|tara:strand:- start:1540 stop:2790 length:1251 start_codon:yes stop_codon:yes gene_type:complete